MAPHRGKQFDPWAQIGFYTSLGFILPAGAVAGGLAGWYFDRWLHTAPVLMIVLGFVGAVGGFIEVLRVLSRAEKDADGDTGSRGSGKS